jgi:hypothetical protein
LIADTVVTFALGWIGGLGIELYGGWSGGSSDREEEERLMLMKKRILAGS